MDSFCSWVQKTKRAQDYVFGNCHKILGNLTFWTKWKRFLELWVCWTHASYDSSVVANSASLLLWRETLFLYLPVDRWAPSGHLSTFFSWNFSFFLLLFPFLPDSSLWGPKAHSVSTVMQLSWLLLFYPQILL